MSTHDSEMPHLDHEDGTNQNGANDSDEESWNEVYEDDDSATICLFCEQTFNQIQPLALDHLRQEHSFDLAALKARLNMDQYSFIKMVNYIRTNKSTPNEITGAAQNLWEDDKYLKPVSIENWLMFDFDGLKVTDHPMVPKTDRQHVEDLLSLLKQKDALLEEATHDVEKLQAKFREMFEEKHEISSCTSKFDEKPVVLDCVSSVPVDQDEGYFSSYAHFGIHHEMLSDEVRTNSYRDAILKNSETFSGKIVLDLGCGTSILSMFASQSGAKQVIAVDQSDIIYQAMDIARNNKFTNISFVKGRLENTEIPVNKVDIIVSEWMGYFLLFEGMLDSVIYAREHHLAPGGILMPNRCNISIVGLGDEQRHQKLIGFWDNVYGFDMSGLRTEVLAEASVEVCPAEHILTESQVVSDLNLMTVDIKCSNFSADFSLKVLRTGRLTAIVGYFDTFFELPNLVEFSTGPAAQPTHWKQTVFYLTEAVAVAEGDMVVGKFSCHRDRKDVRALCVNIEMLGRTMKYHLN